MNTKRQSLMVAIAASLLLGGCGGYFSPATTTKPVSAKQISGVWSFEDLWDQSGTLTLNSDSTFEFVRNTNTSCSGTFTINHGHLAFSSDVGDFFARVIDANSTSAGFGIYGGTTDPDGWVIFTRMSNSPK